MDTQGVEPLTQPIAAVQDVQLRLRDRGSCFNLNSVVFGAAEQWQRSEEGVLFKLQSARMRDK